MRCAVAVLVAILTLSACATPAQMHDEAQLNQIALGCGLALGELIQDESEKRLVVMMKPGATNGQAGCVQRWARRNHLTLYVVSQINFPGT